MPGHAADRNLLFGILALQMDFITREALVTATKDCAREKDKPLGQVLRSQGALAEADEALTSQRGASAMKRIVIASIILLFIGLAGIGGWDLNDFCA